MSKQQGGYKTILVVFDPEFDPTRYRLRTDTEGKHYVESWNTTYCTGCCELGENMGLAHHYPFDAKAGCYVGSGCEECGFTGKRRAPLVFPVEPDPERPGLWRPIDPFEGA